MQVTDFQSSAKKDTESLPLEDLVQFAQAARNHLDGFPTTLREDLAILELKKQELLAQTLTPGDASNVKDEDDAFRTARDVISAIEYRSTFKKALENALASSEAALQTIRATNSRQEL